MSGPLSLDTIVAEFNEDSEAWVLRDATSKKYVTIPHPSYPGRHPIHFFMSRSDAEAVLQEILDVNWALTNREIFPEKVMLIEACKRIAADTTIGHADGFVVHPPNEVYDFIRDRNS